MTARMIADRYEVTERLGRGGGGVVWRARDTRLDRTVAVKEVELPDDLSPDERDRVRARTLREARAAAQLGHRNVVEVYDVHPGDDAIIIVMAFVDAPSLQELVDRDGPLAPARASEIGLDILNALDAAHAAGVIHRDLKPGNVLVPDGGGAMLTDFGIASVLGDTRLTRTGLTLGTPDYMSPEQASDAEVGPATDLWSLGATLYFAVEGAPPFGRDRPIATVHAAATEDPRPTTRAGPLAPVLRELLQKDPAERPDLERTRGRLRGVAEGDDGAATQVMDEDEGEAATQRMAAGGATASLRSDDDEAGATTGTAGTAEGGDGAREDDDHTVRNVAAALVGLLLLIVLLVNVVGGDDDGGIAADSGSPAAATSAPATTEPPEGRNGTEPGAAGAEPEADDDPDADEPRSSSPSPEAGATAADVGAGDVPEGWEVFEGPNYRVAHPEGWTSRDGPASAIDLVAPDGVTYLRVANTEDPAEDVLADTRTIADNFAERQAGYEELRLEATDYRDTDAAVWEYRYTADGRRFHGIHLNMSTGERGYALNYQTPADEWDAQGDRFERFKASFTYPG